jgi:hypothetical protein
MKILGLQGPPQNDEDSSFTDGIASCLDISGTMLFDIDDQPHRWGDGEAIGSHWKAVGSYMVRAINTKTSQNEPTP